VALICPWIESVIQRSVIFMLSYTPNILVYIRNIHIYTEYTAYVFFNIRIVTSLLQSRVSKSRMCIYTLYIHIRYIYAVYDKNALFGSYTYVTIDIVYTRQNGVYIRYIPYALSVTSQAVNPAKSKDTSYLHFAIACMRLDLCIGVSLLIIVLRDVKSFGTRTRHPVPTLLQANR
jgi:hypothetical protein